MTSLAVASHLLVESAHSAFVLRSLTQLSFCVALANLTEMLRPSLGLDPTTGLPEHPAGALAAPDAPVAGAAAAAAVGVAEVVIDSVPVLPAASVPASLLVSRDASVLMPRGAVSSFGVIGDGRSSGSATGGGARAVGRRV